jgi:hypothetical protein
MGRFQIKFGMTGVEFGMTGVEFEARHPELDSGSNDCGNKKS